MTAKRMIRYLALVVVSVVIATLGSFAGMRAGTAAVSAAAPPCNNYSSQVTPPENIGVAITYAGGSMSDVVYPDFKSYVKDVLPYEWNTGWKSASYQAGALAVRMFGWYHVKIWRGNSFNGECYHVTDYTGDQVYCAGIGTPGSGANCHGLGTRPASHATATSFAVQQTWNWILHSPADTIYPTYYKAGYVSDACGQWYGQPAGGLDMSQNGTQACALAGYSWAQIISTYYKPNATYPGDHTYGQWHGAMSWGPEPWKPVSVSAALWKFRNANSCGAPTISPFGYGNPADIKLVGDWDGNGTYTPGVARLVNGILWWYLNNGYDGAAEYSFAYGQAGDIPIVGDWDNNLTVNVGVVRGTGWYLEFSNPPQGQHDILLNYGEGGDTPVPGKWKSQSANQATTPGIFRLENGAAKWYVRDSNTSGPATLIFSYGDYTDRPIAGNYRAGDINTQFGPGVVRDDSTVSCGGMSHNQGWYLRYTPSTGTANVSYKYELIRP